MKIFNRLPSLRVIEADLVGRGFTTNTRQLYLFLWRAKTQPQKLRLGLIFSEKTLAHEIHVSVRTVQRALRTLVEAGLLQVQPRFRQDGGATSNRYVVTWRPGTPVPVDPSVSRVPLTASRPPEEPDSSRTSETLVTPDAVLAWPPVSEGHTPPCQGEDEASTPEGPTVEESLDDPISKNQTFSKSDQLIPGARVLTFASEDALRMFVLAHLTSRGIDSRRLRRWIRRYGLSRIAQLTVWLLSAPAGAIRAPGGWMAHALAEEWAAPAWVRTARTLCLQQARQATRDQVLREKAQAEGEKSQTITEQHRRVWERIAPHLAQLSDLYAYARALAQADLRSACHEVFKVGSLTERMYLVRAAQERPDLWSGVGGLPIMARA